MFWQLIGVAAACLTSFAFVPQVIKMSRTKSAKDVSLITLLQFSFGVSLWIGYGIHLRDYIIIGANAVALLTLVAALLLYYKFMRPA